MCGYFFLFNKNKKISKKKFLEAGNLLSHRGPDDFKTFFDEDINCIFYRLSIQDLSKNGAQPMISKSKKNLILFNGEIYNFKQLKSYLGKNHKLKSNSDTEVILELYEKYGSNILKLLKGMFSILIYSFHNKKIFIARDRFGMKPLYYLNNENYFVVSSEIKSILKISNQAKLNLLPVGDFFFKGYLHHDSETFFTNIFQLDAANFLIYKRNKIFKSEYWSLDKQIKYPSKLSLIKKDIKYLFENSIKDHLVSDVKVSSFLSGGNDTSSIVKTAHKILGHIDTYTYEFKENLNKKDNEINRSKKLSKILGIKNFVKLLDYKNFNSNIDRIIDIVETPITSIRLNAVDSLYKKAKSNKEKVILEGHGGDELMGGYEYNWFSGFVDNRLNKKKIDKRIIFKIFSEKNIKYYGVKKLINSIYILNSQGNFTSDCSEYLLFDLYNINFINHYLEQNKEKIKLKNKNFMKLSQYKEIKKIHLPRVLNYIDKISMNNGIETRLPFLDHELLEYCFNLKSSLKFKNNQQRYLWGKIFRYPTKKNYKKKSVIDPQRLIFKKKLNKYLLEEINCNRIKNSEIFNVNNINKYIRYLDKIDHIDNSFNLMQILSTSKFINNFKLSR